MTANPTADAVADDDRLFCYRHPDRETWVRCGRCGRCDRPICTSCAMQGPVGSRCKQCGKLAFDPLTSFTPAQLALGIATAVVGGLVGGFIASQIGFFSIFVSYFAGGIIADLVGRATGYKRGPVMVGIVFAGLTIGILAGAAAGFWIEYGTLFDLPAGPDGEGFAMQPLIVNAATWALVSVGAACVGAWSRIRFLR